MPIQALVCGLLLKWYFLKDVSIFFLAPVIFLFGLNIAALNLVVKTAVRSLMVGNIIYVVAIIFLGRIGFNADMVNPVTSDLIAMLIPQRAFMQAMLPMSESPVMTARVGIAMTMLILDFIIYKALYIYLDAVSSRRFGIPKPWYFPVERLMRRRKAGTQEESGEDGTVREGVSLREEQLIREVRVVQVKRLSKVFSGGAVRAVDEVSLTLFPSEVICLLGANAAGTSTLTSMLLGMLEPTSGSADIFGLDLIRDLHRVRSMTGFCPQEDILWPSLTVSEHLEIFASLRGDRAGSVGVAKLLADSGFADHQGVQVEKLSGGMKRKLNALIAFSSNNKLVVLDEPTTGLDPVSRRALWEMIGKLKAGRVVCVTTHFIDEAALLSDRVAIMDHGKLKAVGSPMFLKKSLGCESTVSVDQTTGKVQIAGGKLEDVFIRVAGGEKHVAVEKLEGSPSFFSRFAAAFLMRVYLSLRRPFLLISIMAISLACFIGAASLRSYAKTPKGFSEALPSDVPFWLVEDPKCPEFPGSIEFAKKVGWVTPLASDLKTRWQQLVDEHKVKQVVAVAVLECGSEGELPKLSLLFKTSAGAEASVVYATLSKIYRALKGESYVPLRLTQKREQTTVDFMRLEEILLLVLRVVLFSVHVRLFVCANTAPKKFWFQLGLDPVSYWLSNFLFDICLSVLHGFVMLAIMKTQSMGVPFDLALLIVSSMVAIVAVNYIVSLILSKRVLFSAAGISFHFGTSACFFGIYLSDLEASGRAPARTVTCGSAGPRFCRLGASTV